MGTPMDRQRRIWIADTNGLPLSWFVEVERNRHQNGHAFCQSHPEYNWMTMRNGTGFDITRIKAKYARGFKR